MKASSCKSLKSSIILLLLCFCMTNTMAQPVAGGNNPLAGKRVLIVGASITQEGEFVNYMEYYLNRLYPSQKFDIISIGLASETVSGLSEKQHPFPRPNLHNRLQAALDIVKPQIVMAVDYGMNDGIYHPQSPERMQAFKDGVNKLINTVKAANAKLILLTPEPFDPLPVKSVRPITAPDFAYFAPYVGYDSVLSDYTDWEFTIHTPDVMIIDIHTPINNYLKQLRQTNPQFSFGTDGIHPNTAGHLLMAQTILKAMDMNIAGTNLDAEIKRINADPIFPIIARRRQLRSEGWLPYVGYTRDKTVKTNVIEPTETAAYELQAQIDRLR